LNPVPLFRPNPPELFEAGAEIFAGATIATCGFTFNYDLANATVNISAVPIRDWLLAKALPSRTRPMGSTAHSETLWDQANFDMSDPLLEKTFMTNPDNWFHDKTYQGRPAWRHSDFRDAPYVHVHKLYEKLTTKEN